MKNRFEIGHAQVMTGSVFQPDHTALRLPLLAQTGPTEPVS